MKQFVIILVIVFLIQLPGWYLILGRESGGIDDFGNEGWIAIYDVGATIFSFPIYYFIGHKIDGYGLKFLIYIVDLVLLSLVFHLIIYGIKELKRKRISGSPSR
jgi:hypothetical protein